MTAENDLVIPSQIQIETVSGMCNLRCIMCPVHQRKRKEIMDDERFTIILKKLQPYLKFQKYLTIGGMGEPFLDKSITEKIKIGKKLGYQGIGVYTNGMLLTKQLAENILKAQLDSLIFSIDGFTSEVYKAIRVGGNLNTVVSNVEQFISLREQIKSKTKVIIRFTRQEINKHEEDNFHNFWKSKIKSSYDDKIFFYNVHNMGGNFSNFDEKLPKELLKKINNLICSELFDRLMIFSDGTLGLCCGDQEGLIRIGNVLDEDPIKLYNSKKIKRYREVMKKGKILSLDLCKNCSLVYSIATREFLINK